MQIGFCLFKYYYYYQVNEIVCIEALDSLGASLRTPVDLAKTRSRFQDLSGHPTVTIVSSRFCTRTADCNSPMSLRKLPNNISGHRGQNGKDVRQRGGGGGGRANVTGLLAIDARPDF